MIGGGVITIPRMGHGAEGFNNVLALAFGGNSLTSIAAMLERVLVASPCMRQRFLPWTDGDLQDLPVRVLAPQRGLASMGPVLRL